MNEAELSTILFYADFLSLKAISKPVTDNCKYFFVHKVPMNISFICNLCPEYDINNKYFRQAWSEYLLIRGKFGEDGIQSFMGDICNLAAVGTVNATQMLKYIHQYSEKEQRSKAFKTYKNYIKQQKYLHVIRTEDGERTEEECTRYIAHDAAKRHCGRL